MPGVRIRVELDDAELRAALERLAAAGRDLTPAMQYIGEELLNSAKERFRSQTAPDGTPWAPLSEVTRARKPRNKDKILTLEGNLRGTLDYRADADSVEVGSPLIYAGTHHFGAKQGSFGRSRRGGPLPWGDIPARPFLADADGRLAPEDEDAVRTAIYRQLEKAVDGGT